MMPGHALPGRAQGVTPAHAPLLSLQHVSITYEQEAEPVVQDVNFSLFEGETVLFLGPSGCGKSTLAMLCGQLIPRSVEAEVGGEVWYDDRIQHPGQAGYVFQDPDAQFCMLTVADEVAFGLENRAVPTAQMQSRIEGSLALAGMDVALDADPVHFSGGMKQKLAIASVLALEPNLLVFDEPTAHLDPLSTRQVFDQIAHLREAGRTMIVIEHKFDALLPLMDRVVLFDRHGRIHREGPTDEILAKEWAWLVEEGVVAVWQEPPFSRATHRPHRLVRPDYGTFPEDIRPSDEQSATLTNGRTAKRQRTLEQQAQSAPQNHTSSSHTRTTQTVATPSLDRVYELKGVAIAYGTQTILSDLSLNVARGTFAAIVGPNGSGKSSLLQVLSGLKRPSRGTVDFLRRPLHKWPARRRFRAISYSFQNPEFQFIYERVGDELANRGIGQNVPPHVLDLLRQFGLEGLEQHSPFALSQGQKKRLSVAAMMREEHEVYLLDEPTLGQDARTQLAIMERMRTLHRQGKTVILTTHDMDLVRRYAQQVIVVANGGVIFQGTPGALFERDDILCDAHLLADRTTSGERSIDESAARSVVEPVPEETDRKGAVLNNSRKCGAGACFEHAPIQSMHPGWLFLGMFTSSVISLFADTIPEAVAEISIPLVLMTTLGRWTPWRILKLLSPFLVFYVLYFWTFVANAATPPGTPTVHFLWYHLSEYGVRKGLIVSIRMLGSVLFGILFVAQIDITDFMVGICKDFYIKPKFSYGMMAGLRIVPLFSSEWTKLRQARQIRGNRTGSPLLRPVTYALPLLSQGIRMSERIAIAMEARGLFGAAAASSRYRTFYRRVPVRRRDYALCAVMVLLALLGVFAVR